MLNTRPVIKEPFVPTKFTIGRENGITLIRFSEAPTVADAEEVIDRLAKENSYHLRLWDFSRVLFAFTMDEIRAIAGYGKTKFSDKNFLAAVAPQDLAYGTLRAFEVYREEEGHSDARVFRKEQEAIEWLEAQKRFLNS